MSNYYVFDGKNNPVYTKQTNTYISPATVAPPESGAAISGHFYTATASNSVSLGAPGGNVIINLQIANQSANHTMYVSRVSGGVGVSLSLLSSLSASVTLLSGGTLTTPTTVTPANTNLNSANTSAMTARSSTTAITGGTTFYDLIEGGGQFAINFVGGLIVPPGKTLTIGVNASLTLAGLLSTAANVTWWEI